MKFPLQLRGGCRAERGGLLRVAGQLDGGEQLQLQEATTERRGGAAEREGGAARGQRRRLRRHLQPQGQLYNA